MEEKTEKKPGFRVIRRILRSCHGKAAAKNKYTRNINLTQFWRND